jgi:hypothetical protein
MNRKHLYSVLLTVVPKHSIYILIFVKEILDIIVHLPQII